MNPGPALRIAKCGGFKANAFKPSPPGKGARRRRGDRNNRAGARASRSEAWERWRRSRERCESLPGRRLGAGGGRLVDGGPAAKLETQAGDGTRNHAAYNAGRNSSVSAVATVSPPMIATAIG